MLAFLLAVGTTCGQGTVAVWGANILGMAPPPGLTNVVAVSAGGNHILVLNADGTAVSWGPMGCVPTNLPPVSDLVAISAGTLHDLALRSNGTVLAWGDSLYGATAVPAGLSNAIAISAGHIHSLALRGNGTVVAWGRYGGEATVPFGVPAGLTNVTAIAAGTSHDLALLADGHIVAWGDNFMGQTNVPPGLSDVVAIAAGYWHSVALRRDGTVVTWGLTGWGLTSIPPNLSNVVAIAAGGEQSMALQGDGTVVAWGKYNMMTDVFVPDGLGHVSAVAAQLWYNVALIPNQFTWQPLEYVPSTFSVSNGFCLRVWSLVDHGVVVAASSNLVDWEPIFTNPAGGGLKAYVDPVGAGRPSRFYRALVQ